MKVRTEGENVVDHASGQEAEKKYEKKYTAQEERGRLTNACNEFLFFRTCLAEAFGKRWRWQRNNNISDDDGDAHFFIFGVLRDHDAQSLLRKQNQEKRRFIYASLVIARC